MIWNMSQYCNYIMIQQNAECFFEEVVTDNSKWIVQNVTVRNKKKYNEINYKYTSKNVLTSGSFF